MTMDRFDRLWAGSWKDAARAATEGQDGSPSTVEAQAVFLGRQARVQERLTRYTFWLAVATVVLALATVILVLVTVQDEEASPDSGTSMPSLVLSRG